MTPPEWRLVLSGRARRGLGRLRESAAAAVIEALSAIAANPRVGKPLRLGLAGHRSARRGPYRIVYAIDEKIALVTVLAIAHRADVYRRREP